MPLPKRVVEPVHVSRGVIPEDFPLPSELEAATNGTLANTVRQLSSLSRHAEDLFGELAREAHGLATRASSLQQRIDRLAVKVTQLDSNVEEVGLYVQGHTCVAVSLQDIHMRKAFKSSVVFDQQVVSRDTMPTAMLETYTQCDKPPPLDKLNMYREDGKDGLKFYTDANYFFDLWRQEMLKDTERMMHDRGKKWLLGWLVMEPHRPREGGGVRHKKRVRQPHNTRERQRQLAVGHGEHIMPQNVHYRTPQPIQTTDEALLAMGGMVAMNDGRPPRPNSIELRRSYPEEANSVIYSSNSGVYSPRHTQAQSPTDTHYRANYPVGYDENLYQQHYAQGQGMTAVDGYPTPNNQTPSRGSRGMSQRPSQPPPAPPSTNNSSNSTPTVSSATNTPTRGRSMSTGRETLPPPPPPPVESTMSPPLSANGPLPAHLLARQGSGGGSGSRSGSPLPTSYTPHSGTPEPAQVVQPVQQIPQPLVLPQQPQQPIPPTAADLPPPPPSPDQPQPQPQPQPQQQQPPVQQQQPPSPPPPLVRPTSPCNIPPPPPPPPPPPVAMPNGPVAVPVPPTSPPLVNGDVGKSPIKQIISTSPPKLSPPKTETNPARPKTGSAPAPAFDPRSDLLKAIRDGIKLRKVEKNEQKEVERVNALHDVASILARRVAVEFSDSDSASESEYDSEGWGEQETSA